jgi:hypothetical protein
MRRQTRAAQRWTLPTQRCDSAHRYAGPGFGDRRVISAAWGRARHGRAGVAGSVRKEQRLAGQNIVASWLLCEPSRRAAGRHRVSCLWAVAGAAILDVAATAAALVPRHGLGIGEPLGASQIRPQQDWRRRRRAPRHSLGAVVRRRHGWAPSPPEFRSPHPFGSWVLLRSSAVQPLGRPTLAARRCAVLCATVSLRSLLLLALSKVARRARCRGCGTPRASAVGGEALLP